MGYQGVELGVGVTGLHRVAVEILDRRPREVYRRGRGMNRGPVRRHIARRAGRCRPCDVDDVHAELSRRGRHCRPGDIDQIDLEEVVAVIGRQLCRPLIRTYCGDAGRGDVVDVLDVDLWDAGRRGRGDGRPIPIL